MLRVHYCCCHGPVSVMLAEAMILCYFCCCSDPEAVVVVIILLGCGYDCQAVFMAGYVR